MKIEEGNKLIVEFLGGKQVDTIRFQGHRYDIFDLPASFPIQLSEPDIFGMKRTGYLAFHTSWDWLMPVVKKWNDLVISKRTEGKAGWTKWQYKTVMLRTEIEPVYDSLIRALQWYKSNHS